MLNATFDLAPLLPELRFLRMGWGEGEERLTGVGELVNLHTLRLGSERWLDASGAADLARLPNLRQLHLVIGNRNPFILPHVGHSTQLRCLSIGFSRIDGAGLASLSSLAELETLALQMTEQFTDRDLAFLPQLNRLRRLSLTGSAITDAGLENLRHLHGLRRLALNLSRGVQGSGLVWLADLPELRSLILSDCWSLTDDRLELLHSMAQLRELDLSHCHSLSRQAVTRLREALPDCEIRHERSPA
jgi:hypothetical protein